MRINWKKIPKWANYVTQDQTGAIYYWSHKPTKIANQWVPGYPSGEFAPYTKIKNWNKSLKKRPK